jgi:hypothetical protein
LTPSHWFSCRFASRPGRAGPKGAAAAKASVKAEILQSSQLVELINASGHQLRPEGQQVNARKWPKNSCGTA